MCHKKCEITAVLNSIGDPVYWRSFSQQSFPLYFMILLMLFLKRQLYFVQNEYTKDLLVILHKVKAVLPDEEAVCKSMFSLFASFEKVTSFDKVLCVKVIFKNN